MKNTVALKQNRSFRYLYHKGGCCVSENLVLYYKKNRKETNRHAEALMEIESSKDIGKTAWANTSVHKDQLIRKQAAEIAVRTVTDWLAENPSGVNRVIFNVFKDEDREIYAQLLS